MNIRKVVVLIGILIMVAICVVMCMKDKQQAMQMQVIEASDEYQLHWKYVDGRDGYVQHTYYTDTVVPEWYLQVEVNLVIDGHVVQEQKFVPDISPSRFMVGDAWGNAISWEWETDLWNGLADELVREYWTYSNASADEQIMIVWESPGAYHVGGGWWWLRQVEGTGPYKQYFPFVMHHYE